MTDAPDIPALVGEIEADAKAGTPGPWRMERDGQKVSFTHSPKTMDRKEWLEKAWFSFAYAWVQQNGSDEDYPKGMANARRIARTPDLETALLEAHGLIEGLVAALREAGDELDDYYRNEYPTSHPYHVRKRKVALEGNPTRAALDNARKHGYGK